jgi:hypothetical protein
MHFEMCGIFDIVNSYIYTYIVYQYILQNSYKEDKIFRTQYTTNIRKLILTIEKTMQLTMI